MESLEPFEEKKLSKRDRNRLDLLNRFHLMKNDPGSPSFGFSHGNLIFKTIWLTIVGNFLYYALALSFGFVILGLFTAPGHHRNLTFLHFHFSPFTLQWAAYMSSAFTIDLASILLGFGWRRRSIWLAGFFVLVFIVPIVLFHWPFMGD